jgi:hypothetical protein
LEYALTHSELPYAAAIVADNYDGSYFQSVINDTNEYAQFIGAVPFGRGLQDWLVGAPGLNADKVKSPLRLELESGA